MRFVENGPDIPDDLLTAQDKGRVVFFCGAGVSCAKAGLPNFQKLVEKVLDRLGAKKNSLPYKLFKQFKKTGYPSVDAIFSELEKDFDNKKIQSEVAKALQPSRNPDLSAHKIILQLAIQRGSGVRLVTTNFDRLFEKASPKILSRTPVNLFDVRDYEDEWGIVHLHGLVNQNHNGPENPNRFVLNSNEFGAAYLSHGWARDFVSTILEKYVAVFVGYSANDPPIDYLLRGMAHDGNRELKVYAFQADKKSQVTAKWEDKSVIEIPYPEQNAHAALWDSLEAWAKRSKNPSKWQKRIFRLAQKGPEKLKEHERGMIAHIVGTSDGAQAFSTYKPPLPASWLCVFDPLVRRADPASYCLDSDASSQSVSSSAVDSWDAFAFNEQDSQKGAPFRGQPTPLNSYLPKRLQALANWLSQVADSEIAVWWCARQAGLHPYIVESMFWRGSKFKPAIREAWSLTLEALRASPDRHDLFFLLKREIKPLGWNHDLVRRYAALLLPYLESYRALGVPHRPGYKYRQQDLVNFHVQYEEYEKDFWKTIPVEYLPFFIQELQNGIQYALALEKRVNGHLFLYLSSLEQHTNYDPSRHLFGIDAYIAVFIRACQKLGKEKPDELRSLLKYISATNECTERIKLWLCSFAEFASIETYMEAIIELSAETFWTSNARREIMFGIKRRWNYLSLDQRRLIEKRIKRGDPLHRKISDKNEAKTLNALQQLARFTWLAQNDCNLTFNLNRYTKIKQKDAPDWKEEYAQQLMEDSPAKAGIIQPDINPKPLKNIPLQDVIKTASELEILPRQGLTLPTPFIGLCGSSNPRDRRRAIGALHVHRKTHNEFPVSHWEQLLQHSSRDEDTNRTIIVITSRLLETKQRDFSSIIYAVCIWLQKIGLRLHELSQDRFDLLWRKCIANLQDPHAGDSGIISDTDLVTHALNASAGHLARILMDFPKQKGGKKAKYIKGNLVAKWEIYVRDLVNLPEPSGAYALVFFAYNTGWLYHHNKKFASELIVSHLTDTKNDGLLIDAAWSGFLWNSNLPSPALYRILKPAILNRVKTLSSFRKRYRNKLAWLLLAGWPGGFVSDKEFRETLLKAGMEFQISVLHLLSQWTQDEKSDWAKRFPDFMNRVWPRQRMLGAEKVSATLVGLVLGMGDNLENAALAVLPFIVPTETHSLLIRHLHNSEAEVFKNYPNTVVYLLHALLAPNPEHWPYGAQQIIRAMKTSNLEPEAQRKLAEMKARLP